MKDLFTCFYLIIMFQRLCSRFHSQFFTFTSVFYLFRVVLDYKRKINNLVKFLLSNSHQKYKVHMYICPKIIQNLLYVLFTRNSRSNRILPCVVRTDIAIRQYVNRSCFTHKTIESKCEYRKLKMILDHLIVLIPRHNEKALLSRSKGSNSLYYSIEYVKKIRSVKSHKRNGIEYYSIIHTLPKYILLQKSSTDSENGIKGLDGTYNQIELVLVISDKSNAISVSIKLSNPLNG